MAKKNDSLGDRMKGYEGVSRNFLTRRVPAIIRRLPEKDVHCHVRLPRFLCPKRRGL